MDEACRVLAEPIALRECARIDGDEVIAAVNGVEHVQAVQVRDRLPVVVELDSPVRAVVHKDGIYLVNLVSPPMLQQHGFLAKVFAAAERHEIDVDLVATSEVSITMTADRADNLPAFCEELGTLGEVSIEEDHAMLCVVGQGMANIPGVAAKVLGTLFESNVRVRVISQGAIKVNIGLVIDRKDLRTAVGALHAAFFG